MIAELTGDGPHPTIGSPGCGMTCSSRPEFAQQFQRFVENLNQLVPDGQDGIRQRLLEHLGHDPSGHPTLTQQFDRSEHPNLQLAMNRVMAEQPEAELLGLASHLRHHFGFSLTGLLGGEQYGPSAALGGGLRQRPHRQRPHLALRAARHLPAPRRRRAARRADDDG